MVVVIVVGLGCHGSAFAQSALFELAGYFGSKGSEVGQFSGARALVADGQGNIIISDSQNHRIQICDYSGVCTAFGSEGTDPGQFSWPWGIAVDSRGRIIVADRENHRIQVCSYDGNCTAFGGRGSDPGQFWAPEGLDVGSQDRIIVSDHRNDRYQVCDDQGDCAAFDDFFGNSSGVTVHPEGITVDNEDRILIAQNQDLVEFCDYLGNCTSAIGGGDEEGFPGTFRYLIDTAVDSGNRIFTIAVSGIQVCDDQGDCFVYSENFPFDGGYPFNRFINPRGIAVDGQDRILVTDPGHGKILILRFLGTAIKFPINAAISDAWYNPATPGQGFFISVFPDIRHVFLAWFSYELVRPPDDVTAFLGEPGHRWLTAFGPYANDQALLDVEITRGGVFDASQPPPEQTVYEGGITLEFSDCDTGTVAYDIEQANVQGAIPIRRIAADNVAFCEELVPLTPLR
jgi:DNA-binding beta-propeller fold protein YncE